MKKRILGFSGGKDSTALYLWMMEKGLEFEPVYADTGFESQITYDYVTSLPEKVGGPAVRIVKADLSKDVMRKKKNLPASWRSKGISEERIEKAVALLNPTGNPFLDLCISRGGFPSFHHRFCTDHLKIKPFIYQVYEPLFNEGHDVVSYQGIRREESRARSKMRMIESKSELGIDYRIVRPLLAWKVGDVMNKLASHGVKPNPLYLKGFSRVGCWPCINSRKSDVRAWANFDPAAVERIKEWEALVSQVTPSGESTLFYGSRLSDQRPIVPETHGIAVKVKWANTDYGGRQFRLLDAVEKEQSEAEKEWGSSCAIHGVCE